MIAATPFTELSIPIQRIPKADAVKQIRLWIDGCELEYGITSEQMLQAVRSSELEETQELTSWAFWYRTLAILTS